MICDPAQDLLNQWVTDKIHLENDFDDCGEEAWNRKTQADIKQQWDNLLSSDADLEANVLSSQLISNRSEKTRPKKNREKG